MDKFTRLKQLIKETVKDNSRHNSQLIILLKLMEQIDNEEKEENRKFIQDTQLPTQY